MTSEFNDPALGSPAPLAREVSFDIERAVLQLVVDGFERWQSRGFQRFGDYENHFTVRFGRVHERDSAVSVNMSLVPRYQHVEPTDDMRAGREDPARAPCIDMVISWDSLTEDAYLSIECKRLAPNDLARLYVACGIDRFVRGYYGAKAQAGAMVGYVIPRHSWCGTQTHQCSRRKVSGHGSESHVDVRWCDWIDKHRV